MFSRSTFILLLILGLATGPVVPAGNCPAPLGCAHCCPEKGPGCCAQSGEPAQEAPLSAPRGVELKLALWPARICLGVLPELARPPDAVRERLAARRVAPALVAVTCIRLI